jgi:hypothetical protein
MRKRLLALPAAGLALGLLGAAPAQAHDHGMPAGAPGAGPVAADAPSPNGFVPRFFVARLSGANEVQVAGKPKVGDPDGSGVALLRVQGSRVTFSLEWSGITAPTLGHIHQGVAGVNGDVKVPLFGTPMPDTATAAAGAVTVSDPQIAKDILADPAGFYVNLHSTQFGGGAVRGQLSPLRGYADVLGIVHGGARRAFLSGDQEVPVAGKPPVGDPDGRAVAFIRPGKDQVSYSLAWIGVTPTLGHIHQGRFGTNGDVKVMLFGTPVPDSIVAMSGTVTGVDPTLIRQIRATPGQFYVNLHTLDFGGGAVRGQLTR